jgi:hypothetical protein
MALTNDQKIDCIKIIIGVIFSVVAAFWTYTTYTENERNNELKTLIALGDSIAGMHVTCKTDFGKLAALADKGKDSREGRCYAYFQDAHRRSLAAMISVGKPMFSSSNTWVSYWNDLQKEIARAGSEQYKFNSIENAWVDILIAKGIKEKRKENK